MTRLRRLGVVATLLVSMGLLLALPSAVLADQFVGTTLTPSDDLCVGQTYQFTLTGTFRRSDTGEQYPDGATLTITDVSGSVPNVTVALVSITDAAAILPADWTSQSFPFAASDTVSATVSLTPTAPGEWFGSLDWEVSANGSPFAIESNAVLVDEAVDCDADNDGVANADDLCPGTVLPDPAPPSPQKNHYRANASGNFVDVKTGAVSTIGLDDTGGCSAAQIVVAAGLGKGHTKNGISGSALNAWVASH